MKAIVCREYGDIGNLAFVSMANPQAGEGEVVVRLKAAALNFLDTLIVQGRYQVKPATPFVPGAEMAGVVSQVGAGVDHVKVGDCAIVRGTYGCLAEEVLVGGSAVLPIAEPADWGSAAALSVTYSTAYHALLHRAQISSADTVLVLGAAGGVGTAAIQVAKALGARVIAACSGQARGELCRKVGADVAVDYAQGDLREQLKAAGGAGGIDVVLDNVGGPFAEPALRSLNKAGRYLVVGFASGDIPKFPANLLLLKGASVMGVNADFSRAGGTAYASAMQELVNWERSGRIKPVIGARYRLEDASKALQSLADRGTYGKVVVEHH